MFTSDTVWSFFLIAQFCIGITGNLLLFMSYVITFIVHPHSTKPIDSIFMHLMVVNILTITVILIPDITASFGVRRFLDDVGCKAILYIFRVTRGVSMGTTSTLTTFQAISVTPSNSKWAWIKTKLFTWTCSSLLFSWIINIPIYVKLIEVVIAKTNSTHPIHGYPHAYCKNRHMGAHDSESFLIAMLIQDVFFVTVMILSSFYMVIFLYGHHRRAQNIRSHSFSFQPSPESKATHHILLLVSCFVFFYLSNNFVTLYGLYVSLKNETLGKITRILSSCYPTLCPFILGKKNKIISQFSSFLFILRINCFQRAFNG